MRRVRLIREVLRPTGRGPGNGQYALQRLLRRRIDEGLDWLVLGGPPQEGELPWFWSWEDRAAAVRWAGRGGPFVQGPNTLFLQSKRPRIDPLECALLDAAGCRMMFTESAWYRELILRHRGPANRGPVVLWPYPIDPRPPGPAPQPRHDLLIYVKNGGFPGLCEDLRARFRSSRAIGYGSYRREDLWDLARVCRSCAYLADDDRGPLALAEILLCGCPTAGLPTGAPFVEPGRSGFFVEPSTVRRGQVRSAVERPDQPAVGARCCAEIGPAAPRCSPSAAWIDAIRRCQELDRREVAARAAARFDAAGIVDTVLAGLDDARHEGDRSDLPQSGP